VIKITKKDKSAWVTFSILPQDVQSVKLCGSWNEWKEEPMNMKKSGEYYLRRKLDLKREYQFGYLIDDKWSCDNELECVASPFGSQNSLLKL
jgi:1,4-alpha-glucan branching enzyme